MDTLSKYFWIIIIATLFVIGYKIAPIYYNYFSIRSICQEQVDRYHKYNRNYINKRVEEKLTRLGIPKDQRSHNITVTDEAVYIDIHYEDIANFFEKYKKKFVFDHRCKGVLESVLE